MFCRGVKCRRCGKDAYTLCEDSPIKKIHANWITEHILAMQRPADDHFVRHKFVEQLKDNNIAAVFNLQEPGEHPFCGFGIKESGFSYYPEKLMAAGIKFFNYSWKDMTTPPVAMMLDIVRIALNEINNGGKVAVHCHAGFGRTGIVIASIMIAQHRFDAEFTINTIREKRPGSVQTTQQQVFVYEFKSAYSQMEEFFPPCSFNLPHTDNNLSGLKTIATSEKDQHYCLAPDEAMKYAKCPKPVSLSIDLLTTASMISAALTSCFIIGLHPNLVVKSDKFDGSEPLFMPELEQEILIPKHSAMVPVDSTPEPIVKMEAPNTGTESNTNKELDISLSGNGGVDKLKDLESDATRSIPPKSSRRSVVKKFSEHSLAYRVVHSKNTPATFDWISEEAIVHFKSEANTGNWSRWIPPKTTLHRSTPSQAAERNMSIVQLSQSIELVQKTPRQPSGVTPRVNMPQNSPAKDHLSQNLVDDKEMKGSTQENSLPSLVCEVPGEGTQNTSSSLPPVYHSGDSSSNHAVHSSNRRLSGKSMGSSLPQLSVQSPLKPDHAQLLGCTSTVTPDKLSHTRSKSFSSLNEYDSNVHVQPKEKVADDHVSEAMIKAELEAKEKLLSLQISLKRKTSKTELLDGPLVSERSGDAETRRHNFTPLNLHRLSLSNTPHTALGCLEMLQALGEKTEDNFEHEGYYFLGGILLVDWLESRADPLLDDEVLEILSDAWCKSMSTKNDKGNSGKVHMMSGVGTSATPCAPVDETCDDNIPAGLSAQGKSTSFFGGLVDSFSPERPKNRKMNSIKSRKVKLGRGSTYASFGVEGEPVTGKILDEILKKHMPRFVLQQ